MYADSRVLMLICFASLRLCGENFYCYKFDYQYKINFPQRRKDLNFHNKLLILSAANLESIRFSELFA
jgi:hypothetical protein